MATDAGLIVFPEDKNMGTVLLVLTSVLIFFTITTTVLRLCARYSRGVIGWDDYTIGICCLLAIGRFIIQTISVKYGNGRHKVYLSAHNYEYVNFCTWMTQIFLFLNIGLLKCSICILILRIKDSRLWNYGLYIMMGGLVVTNLECVFVLLAQCNPVKKYWQPSVPGKCWDTKVRIYSIYLQVAYSVITDLICALLPVIILWKVQMARSLKAAVCGLMGLGLIATAAAIVRASSLGTRVTDLSYDYCIAAIWANTELHLGIIATNLSLARSIYGFVTGRSRIGTGDSSSLKETSNTIANARGFGTNPYLSRKRTQRGEMGSESSQIELGVSPGVKDQQHVVKTTEFHLEEEFREGESRGTVNANVVQQSWNRKDST